MDSIWQDFRFGITLIYKNLKFSAIIVFCLALGIGPNATIFSLLNALILRPFEAHQPDRLVRIKTLRGFDAEQNQTSLTYPDCETLNRDATKFTGIIARSGTSVVARIAGEARTLYTETVSSNYFDVLGVTPLLGSTFHLQDEELPGSQPFVVLGYRFWLDQYAGDPAVVGRKMTLNGYDFKILGVMPPKFTGTQQGIQADIWTSLSQSLHTRPNDDTRLTSRNHFWLEVHGRLAAGVTLDQANLELAALGEKYAGEFPDTNENSSFIALDLQSPQVIIAVIGVLLVVSIVLLVACASVAALLLARSTERTREIAIRIALGATRRRLIRQLLTESLMLGLLAGVIGLLGALWTVDFFPLLLPELPMRVMVNTDLNWSVLGYTTLLAMIATLIFGLAPALQTTKPDVFAALKDQPLAVPSNAGTSRLRNAFVIAQFSMSIMLLIYSALFVRSLTKVNDVDLHFQPDDLMTYRTDLRQIGFSGEEQSTFAEELRTRLAQVPGVTSVSIARSVPMGLDHSNTNITPIDESMTSGERQSCSYTFIAPAFFSTLGMPLLAGREFTSQDGTYLNPVIIVNEELASRLWPGANPLGKLVTTPYSQEAFEVVGLVPTSKYGHLGEGETPFFYIPLMEDISHSISFLMRTEGDQSKVEEGIRQAISAAHPDLALNMLQPYRQVYEFILLPARIGALLLGGLGLLALILAVIGVYGVVSYSVNLRSREVGIRLALGAKPNALVVMLLQKGLLLIGIGTAIGLAVTLTINLTFDQISLALIEVSPTDPLVFICAPLLLAGIAVLAVYRPARQTTRMDPMEALRYE